MYATYLFIETQLGKRPRVIEDEVVSFLEEDRDHITTPHNDALVISTIIDVFDTKRIQWMEEYRLPSSSWILLKIWDAA